MEKRRGSLRAVLVAAAAALIATMPSPGEAAYGGASVSPDHYKSSCPNLEFIVRWEVSKKINETVVTIPAVLRLFFHDCLVNTDTASVLQETIGYIRFLLGQIEALSYPYIGHGNGNSMQNGPVGERNSGVFPEYPGQLLNHNNNTGAQQAAGQPEQQVVNDEAKDLRSRGLCLVPVSCTSHFGGDNAADYWAPAPLGGLLR